MADISKIQLPDSDEIYNLKDQSARDDLDVIKPKVGTPSFAITENIVTVTLDATKGVAPWSTSYGMTYIEISKDAGVRWVEGAVYSFIVNTKMVVASANRNVAIRIGGANDGDVWHPLMAYSTSILAGSTYLVKAMTCYFQYKTTMRPEGGLHLYYDANSTYAYLVNTITADTTDAPITIDANGYGARYSLMFPTSPLADDNGIVVNETWSSLVKSSSTATTKIAATPTNGKFYIDRPPCYVYSANIAAGAKPVNSLYQNYTGTDVRYSVNTSATYVTARRKLFLWLKNYDPINLTFEADATIGNIMSIDKISTRFPSTTDGDVFLYFLGWSTATWYSLTPTFSNENRIFKYTPATQELVAFNPYNASQGLVVESLPQATSKHVGTLIVVKGESNDRVYMCLKKNGTYAWIPLDAAILR